MNLCGRVAPVRRKEARRKGYVILSLRQLEFLKKNIAPYIKNNVIDVETVAGLVGTYESTLLTLLEIYQKAGINIVPKYPPQVSPRQQKTESEIEPVEESQSEVDKFLENYRAGQEQSYKAMEHIMDMLKQKDTKINDLEKRISELEKLIKK